MNKIYPINKKNELDGIYTIPDTWKFSKIRYITSISYGNSLKEEVRVDGDYDVYGSNGVVGSHNIPLTSGETLIIGRKGSFGKINLSKNPCYPIDTTFFIEQKNTENNIKWLFYGLSILELDSFSKDSSVPGINREEIYERYLPQPSIAEQKKIVFFLDHKIKLIENLIKKTKQKIELLKEKRTFLINHCVIKGLNPNVEVKDSGIEWIGKIPVDWNKTKLSYYCEIKDGTHDTPPYVDEGGIPLVTQKDISGGKLDFSKTKNISYEDYKQINLRSNVIKGDIIMSMIGSIGNPSIVDVETPFSIKNVCLFKTSDSQENTKYIFYLLLSDVLATELMYNSRGGVQGFVSLNVLRNLLFIKPPVSEQQQIVDYLDSQTQKIDILIEKENKRIELLKEYRQSLISETVTGKIDLTYEVAV